jgi:hypothetical protein
MQFCAGPAALATGLEGGFASTGAVKAKRGAANTATSGGERNLAIIMHLLEAAVRFPADIICPPGDSRNGQW